MKNTVTQFIGDKKYHSGELTTSSANARSQGLHKKESIYKNVTCVKRAGAYKYWMGRVEVEGKRQTKLFSRADGKCAESERAAAKWVDLQLIRAGKEPVNILKRK